MQAYKEQHILFKVQPKKGNTAEVSIYDSIGEDNFGGGVSAEGFMAQIIALKLTEGDELVVKINSLGGSFTEGNAIYNILRMIKAKVITRIDGIAASAASIIALAGDRVEMPENALMFIHNPWTVVAGDANAMRKEAEVLDSLKANAMGTYMRRIGNKISKEKLEEMLDAGTYINATDAVKFGLADIVDEPIRAFAMHKVDFARFGLPIPTETIKTSIATYRKQLKSLKV